MAHLRPGFRPPETIGEDPEDLAFLGTSAGRRLLCRACRQAVTTEEQRIEIDGRHVHRRVNPAGIRFEFGCFGRAPGAVAVGEPTAEHSWFTGRRWSFSLCRACGAHLGWLFEGEPPRFQGLILNRLELDEETDA